MKTELRIDYNTNTLIMNCAFAKAAARVGSKEYEKLKNVRKENPEIKLSIRTIKRNPNKECYRGLTYKYMESYIESHDDDANSIMKKYKELRVLAECHSIRYPNIKAWFLNQFPEIESFGRIKDTEQSEIVENTLSIVTKPLNEKVA